MIEKYGVYKEEIEKLKNTEGKIDIKIFLQMPALIARENIYQ
jgi:hypothetical protein